MSIQLVDSNMKKGLAIIVGDKVDGIILHAAKLLSDTPIFLKDITKDIIAESSYIYLLGHGKYTNYTIDNKSAETIAKKLEEVDYSGQTLEILSCDAGLTYKSKCFYTEFIKVLKEKSINTSNVFCKAYGKTIITTDKYNGNVVYYVVNDIRSDYVDMIQGLYKNRKKLSNIGDLVLVEKCAIQVYLFKLWLINYFNSQIKGVDKVKLGNRLGLLSGLFLSTLFYSGSAACQINFTLALDIYMSDKGYSWQSSILFFVIICVICLLLNQLVHNENIEIFFSVILLFSFFLVVFLSCCIASLYLDTGLIALFAFVIFILIGVYIFKFIFNLE